MEIPKLVLEKVDENPLCFGCGKENPYSLKMKSFMDGDIAKSEFVPTQFHQGWPGYVHGGALMAAIDETIGWVVFQKNIYAVTAKIEVRLKSMACVGELLVLTSRITKQTRRTLEVEVQVQRPDGSIVAEASSVQYIVQTS
jgi:acyl-coenzyme A thioesterase PaaI-like protein